MAVFGQQFCFARGDAPEPFEICQVLDLMPEPGPTGDRVVIGQGDEVEALLGGGSEKFNGADARFLIVNRSRSVDMQVRAVPLFGCLGGMLW